MIRCIGFDPGITACAYVIVDDSTLALPLVLECRVVTLTHQTPAAEAYDLTIDLLRANPAAIVGVETYRHRRWLGRAVNSAPEMGAVVTAVELAARSHAAPLYPIEPAEHRNTIPRTAYAKTLRNQHLRDAYSVAVAAIGHHRLAKVQAMRGSDDG